MDEDGSTVLNDCNDSDANLTPFDVDTDEPSSHVRVIVMTAMRQLEL